MQATIIPNLAILISSILSLLNLLIAPNTIKQLAAVDYNSSGKYLVVQLLVDHVQPHCMDIPKGSRGIIVANRPGEVLVRFPLEVLDGKDNVWTDGIIRVLKDKNNYNPIGRVG